MNQISNNLNTEADLDIQIKCVVHKTQNIDVISLNKQINNQKEQRLFCDQCSTNGIKMKNLQYGLKEYKKYYEDDTSTFETCFTDITNLKKTLIELPFLFNCLMEQTQICITKIEEKVKNTQIVKPIKDCTYSDLETFVSYLSLDDSEKQSEKEKNKTKYNQFREEIIEFLQKNEQKMFLKCFELREIINHIIVLQKILFKNENVIQNSEKKLKQNQREQKLQAKMEQIIQIQCLNHKDYLISKLNMGADQTIRTACNKCLLERNSPCVKYPEILKTQEDFKDIYKKTMMIVENTTENIIDLLISNKSSLENLQTENSLMLVTLQELNKCQKQIYQKNTFENILSQKDLEQFAEYLYDVFYKMQGLNETEQKYLTQLNNSFFSLNSLKGQFNDKLEFNAKYKQLQKDIQEQFLQIENQIVSLKLQLDGGTILNAHLHEDRLYIVRHYSVIIYKYTDNKLDYQNILFTDHQITKFKIRKQLDYFVTERTSTQLIICYLEKNNKFEKIKEDSLITQEPIENFYLGLKEKIIYIINKQRICIYIFSSQNVWKIESSFSIANSEIMMHDLEAQGQVFFFGKESYQFLRQGKSEKEKFKIIAMKTQFNNETIKCISSVKQNSKPRSSSSAPKGRTAPQLQKTESLYWFYILTNKAIYKLEIDIDKLTTLSIKSKPTFIDYKFFGMFQNNLLTISLMDGNINSSYSNMGEVIVGNQKIEENDKIKYHLSNMGEVIVGNQKIEEKGKTIQILSFLDFCQDSIKFLTFDQNIQVKIKIEERNINQIKFESSDTKTPW